MSPADEIAIAEERGTSSVQPSAEAEKLKFDFEKITPEQASKLLETAVDPIEDKKAIATYAQSMANGAWIKNGQTIIIDEEGRLIDGVQRLNACVKAGVPFETAVARNVRSDILHTIDQHRRRSYQNVLESRGVNNAGAVVRTMSKLIRIENGSLGREKLPISWSRYDLVLAANPEIVEACEIAKKASGSRLHSTARPALAFMALRAGHRDKLMSFLREVGPDRTAGLDTPPGLFCMILSILEDRDTSLPVDTTLALAVQAFNDHVAGKKVSKHYAWEPDLGTTPLDDAGRPISGKALREHAPANLGLPLVDGYPGLLEGRYDTASVTDTFGGRTDEEVQQGTQEDEGKEKIRMMTVTPDMARDWLQFNAGNRKIQKNHIKMIARDITKGNWQLNAQPICFTGDPMKPKKGNPPRLLNGQHRLHALIEADIPIEIPIAINIPEAAFATFDTHAKRTVRRMGSRVDDRVLAAAAKIQWKLDNGYKLTHTGDAPSATEIITTLERHPDLANGFSRARRKGMKEIGSAGVMTWFIYHVTHEHKELGEEFLDGLEYGANLDKGNPILRLRNRIKGTRVNTGTVRLSRADTLILLDDHWEAFKKWKAEQAEKAGSGQPHLI